MPGTSAAQAAYSFSSGGQPMRGATLHPSGAGPSSYQGPASAYYPSPLMTSTASL